MHTLGLGLLVDCTHLDECTHVCLHVGPSKEQGLAPVGDPKAQMASDGTAVKIFENLPLYSYVVPTEIT